ncbi:MAG: gluconolactonase [Hyphomicrobiaceae bacterium]|jgi:gluconolactonase
MSEPRLITSGLRFPEGPIAMADGSIVLVEIERGTLSRVQPSGSIEVIATLGGGPNGAAIGPDGKCYVCNNGGFEWIEVEGLLVPGEEPADFSGGRIERVDLDTGEVEVLYTQCNGNPLRGPNDIVFDRQGGFWFTDHGKTQARTRDHGGVYYASTDGTSIREAVYPINSANGVGLSPDEKTLYVAETMTCRLYAFDLDAPGSIVPKGGLLVRDGECIAGPGGLQLFDSLAVDADGNVCVATILNAGITIVSPDGSEVRHIATDDLMTTNICFGGPDLKTAFITLSSTGRLISMDWERPGLALNFLQR